MGEGCLQCTRLITVETRTLRVSSRLTTVFDSIPGDHYCDMVLQQFIPDHKARMKRPLDIDSERITISHNGHHRITSDTVYQTRVSLFACQRLNSPECNYRDY